MRPERWSFVPHTLGLILLAAGSAAGHELMMLGNDGNWSLLVRAELEFYSGLWLFCGPSPRRNRILALTVFVGVFLYDLSRAITGVPPRYALGRIAVGPWWTLGIDLAIIIALQCWRPAGIPRHGIDSHPGRAAGTALIAAALGVAVDWSQIGYSPIIETATPVGRSSHGGMDYLVYTPDGYCCSLSRWPLILFLHGAGAVGHDIDRVRREGLCRRIEAKWSLPFVVVAPQSPVGGWDVGALNVLLGEVLQRYRINEDKVYLTGQSMGGYGAWAMAAAHPERFAAVAPVCGGGDPAWAERLRSVPIWAFHGAEDTVIPPDESRRMVAAIERAGGEVSLTIYPGVGHDAWTKTYADGRFYDWLLAHRRPLK
jgi:pimeloyl-ACP methyl ester carboxylesterase